MANVEESTVIVLTCPPNWSLPSLNIFIAQQENFLRGRLTSIRRDGETTVLNIDDEKGEKPRVNTVVTSGSPPPGARVVGSAEIYLESTPRPVTAYRLGEP
jgi:hypothetical protein